MTNERLEMADIWNKYADTAARRHGKPGRDVRPKSMTIDAHTHIAVPRAAEFIKPHLDVSTIPLAHFSSAETKAINAKQEADIRGCMTGYDERFAVMDKMGVDAQLVMPPPPQCYHTVALEYAVPAAQMINDGVAEFVSRHPDRFIPTGTVPMQDGN
jgi:aminocarboxymuconate-semialdehyde decarboxylase